MISFKLCLTSLLLSEAKLTTPSKVLLLFIYFCFCKDGITVKTEAPALLDCSLKCLCGCCACAMVFGVSVSDPQFWRKGLGGSREDRVLYPWLQMTFFTYKDCSEATWSKGTSLSGPGESQGETSAFVLGSPWFLCGMISSPAPRLFFHFCHFKCQENVWYG